MIVADYKKGLLIFDPKEITIKPFLPRSVRFLLILAAGCFSCDIHHCSRNLESWKGLNDLVIASNGDICTFVSIRLAHPAR